MNRHTYVPLPSTSPGRGFLVVSTALDERYVCRRYRQWSSVSFAAYGAALADTTCHQWPYVRHWTQTCQDTPGRPSWATCSCQLLTALPPPVVLGEGLLVREGQWVAGIQEGGTLVEVVLAWKTYLEFPVHVFVQANTNKGKHGLMVLNQSVITKIQ